MVIARVLNGIVINLEVADQDWVDSNIANDQGYLFIPIDDENWLPAIGSRWSDDKGFSEIVTTGHVGEDVIDINDDLGKEIEDALAG